MQRFAGFILVCVLLLSAAGCASRCVGSLNENAIAVLESLNADTDARARAVSSIRSLSDEDRRRLLAAVARTDPDFANHKAYVYQALIEHTDTTIVRGLGELLLKQDARYHAVALGIIGDTEAIPYLHRAMRTSSHNYVRNNCRQALRILGVRSSLAHLPDPTHLHYPVTVSIQANTKQLRLGERVTITVEYKNRSKERSSTIYPIWIDPFHAISVEGDHVDRLPGPSIFYEITAESFRRLDPGETYTRSETFELVVKPIVVDRWIAFKNKTFNMLCLDRVEPASGGWELARFVEGQCVTLQISSVYNPVDYRSFVDELGIEQFDYKPLVPAPVVLKCIAIGSGAAKP